MAKMNGFISLKKKVCLDFEFNNIGKLVRIIMKPKILRAYSVTDAPDVQKETYLGRRKYI